MTRLSAGTIVLICSCLRVAGQDLQFEVASVKPSSPPSDGSPPAPRPQGGPGTSDPTRISYRYIPLSWLITMAYDINGADLVGPRWLTTVEFMGIQDKYDIEATLAPNTSKEQFHLMLQNLLAERFALKAHREKKVVPSYALVVANGGLKIKESPAVPDGADPDPKVDVRVRGDDGFPATPPAYSGLFVSVKSGYTRVKFIRYSMEQFAKWTRVNSKRPGVDRTGLTGRYDFYLEYGNEIGSRGSEGKTPELVDRGDVFMVALQKQLGLKLEPDSTEIDILIIDHIDRTPTSN
jgi:uncharacterized protein (TIGR03435 family)